ncbi:MAG: iron-containing alcohol dehydrogenase [Nitriliruptor sp.]|nr:MAG: iron-containing alcohol dehydrogenase [Nitriliruptor sp.]TVR20980.1 MAG: iron-containing alcohol dehydrogenase [Nitriliruptor sp.]
MPLLARTVATPIAIVVRPGAVEALAPLLSDGRISSGGKVALVVSPGRGDAIGARLLEQLPRARVIPVEGGTLDGALELMSRLREDFYDAVVGIGGGRTLDVGKYAASMAGLPFVSVSTTLTHDGVASPVASLENRGRKASYGVHVPIAVFVDIDEVRSAPAEHLASGVGDVLSNLSAIADWELARSVRGEAVDGLSVSLARSAAEAVIDAEPGSDRFLTIVADSLIMSGLSMMVAGTSRPCSGACHEISHALDAYHGSPGLHGAQVALGALFASWLRAGEGIEDGGLFERLDVALRVHGLPRTPAALDITSAQFSAAVIDAPRTRPDRFTVLEHLDLPASRIEELVDAFVATVDR